MTVTKFIKQAYLALSCETAYIKGGFGFPMNQKNKQRVINQYSFNKKREGTINALSENCFGFDCICFIKAILWGWNANKQKEYGGAVYKSNGVPDSTIETFRKNCTNMSTDFSRIVPGEIVFSGNEHAGIYVGNGYVIEATTKYSKTGGCFLSWCNNIAKRDTGYNREWECHGFCPYVDYE